MVQPQLQRRRRFIALEHDHKAFAAAKEIHGRETRHFRCDAWPTFLCEDCNLHFFYGADKACMKSLLGQEHWGDEQMVRF